MLRTTITRSVFRINTTSTLFSVAQFERLYLLIWVNLSLASVFDIVDIFFRLTFRPLSSRVFASVVFFYHHHVYHVAFVSCSSCIGSTQRNKVRRKFYGSHLAIAHALQLTLSTRYMKRGIYVVGSNKTRRELKTHLLDS